METRWGLAWVQELARRMDLLWDAQLAALTAKYLVKLLVQG